MIAHIFPVKKQQDILNSYDPRSDHYHRFVDNLFPLPQHLPGLPVHLFPSHHPFCLFLPNRVVLFSLRISTVYILLVYLYSRLDPQAVAISIAWFVVFVTIGVVTSSFSTGLREEEPKSQGIFENSQTGIFKFDLDTTATHRDQWEMSPDPQVRAFRTHRYEPVAKWSAIAENRDRFAGRSVRAG